jgi:hypothetical protein
MKTCRYVVALAALALVAAPALADGGANHQVKQTPPVKMGTSGGSVADRSNAFCCGGTLGSLVLRDGVLSILSNNHVLARAGSAVVGEDAVQPGLIDSNCSGTNSNIVGDFVGDLVPLGTANVDAAISTARANVDATGAIIDVGVPCNTTQAATVGLAVTKSGRTTGQTTGTIQSVNTSVSIQYQKGCNSGKKFTISYTNQVVAVAGSGSFSAGGDSGSLIVSNDGTPNPVALLFAGNSSQTIGNPITAVVSAFQAGGHTFSFVGSSCGNLVAASSNLGGSLSRFPSEAEVDFTRTVKERFETELMGRPGVIGVGVGADETDASRGAIIVYLSTAAGAHPQPYNFPAELDGVPVRVIPTEPFVAQ